MGLNQGLWSTHAAVLLFGMTALFSKLIDLPALDIQPLRSIFAVLALWLFILWRGERLRLASWPDTAMMGLLGILMALHWVTYFHSMQVSTVAIGVISLYTFPVITVFLEPLFYRARPRWQDILSALLVIFGIYLMVPDFNIDNSTMQGVVWGVISAFLFALRNILQRQRMAAYSAQQSLFFQALVVLLLLMPLVGERAAEVSVWQWGQLAFLGVFFTALPHALFMHGLRFLEAKRASLIACLQVVYSAILAAIILAEMPAIETLLGGFLVVSAAVYETYTARPSAPQK